MAITTWRRPALMRSLRPELDEFNRAMSRIFGDVYPAGAEYPPVNVWMGSDDIVLTAEVPGIEPDDLDISVQENSLTLSCRPGRQKTEEGASYHRRECPRGGFARSWQLPFEVDRDRIDARLDDGILQLTLPRSEASKPRKVEVKAR